MVEQSLYRNIILTFTTTKEEFKSIRPGDEHFTMFDGIKVVPRASFEIGKGCPEYFKTIIAKAYTEGWLIPIANVKSKELFWEVLGD
jgi:hypothetical protein